MVWILCALVVSTCLALSLVRVDVVVHASGRAGAKGGDVLVASPWTGPVLRNLVVDGTKVARGDVIAVVGSDPTGQFPPAGASPADVGSSSPGEAERAGNGSRLIVAPASGTIWRHPREAHKSYLNQGETLALLTPGGDIEVRLVVPETDMGLVAEGHPVVIRPVRRTGGPSTYEGRVTGVQPPAPSDGLASPPARVSVSISGCVQGDACAGLLPGAAVTAQVTVARRSAAVELTRALLRIRD